VAYFFGSPCIHAASHLMRAYDLAFLESSCIHATCSYKCISLRYRNEMCAVSVAFVSTDACLFNFQITHLLRVRQRGNGSRLCGCINSFKMPMAGLLCVAINLFCNAPMA